MAKKRPGRIEDDTPILPYMVADSVISEVDRCVPLRMTQAEERTLADKLADHADTVYQRNEKFRRQLRARGNKGRDTLYAFMRHWLSSELKAARPAVFQRLPADFMTGAPLRCGALRPDFSVAGRRKRR